MTVYYDKKTDTLVPTKPDVKSIDDVQQFFIDNLGGRKPMIARSDGSVEIDIKMSDLTTGQKGQLKALLAVLR